MITGTTRPRHIADDQKTLNQVEIFQAFLSHFVCRFLDEPELTHLWDMLSGETPVVLRLTA
jgi:hypothetical protein